MVGRDSMNLLVSALEMHVALLKGAWGSFWVVLMEKRGCCGFACEFEALVRSGWQISVSLCFRAAQAFE